mmetsp:Transcript_3391/g.6648  ORF Transcript_3391/g.6648 Transcript_3391/m.6648 type:complete len:86 (+) Transcript_3391:1269-1526(+)
MSIDMASTFAYLHEIGVCHRDIKVRTHSLDDSFTCSYISLSNEIFKEKLARENKNKQVEPAKTSTPKMRGRKKKRVQTRTKLCMA